MATLQTQMDGLSEKVKNLIRLCEAFQEENDLLKLENQSLEVALETSSQKITELNKKVKAMELSKSFESTKEQDEAIEKRISDTKLKIDGFVKEIDKCIDMLK